MSNSYDEVDLSFAYNEGHNDAWRGRPPKEFPPHLSFHDQKRQKYRAGHAAGVTARYWFNKGRESILNQG